MVKIVNRFPIYQRTIKFKIGYVPQYGGYFHDLTVYENLKAISEICIEDKN
jgi:lipopolysaccharide export system ATP-binding protein